MPPKVLKRDNFFGNQSGPRASQIRTAGNDGETVWNYDGRRANGVVDEAEMGPLRLFSPPIGFPDNTADSTRSSKLLSDLPAARVFLPILVAGSHFIACSD